MKTKFIILALIFATSLFAQEKPKVSSAVIAYNNSDFAKAKKYIDEADEILAGKDYNSSDVKTLMFCVLSFVFKKFLPKFNAGFT